MKRLYVALYNKLDEMVDCIDVFEGSAAVMTYSHWLGYRRRGDYVVLTADTPPINGGPSETLRDSRD